MLYVHRSNRVERLVERLAQTLGRPLADPMATEIVVVHSQGMQRWLSQRLSQRLGAAAGTSAGICANVDYPFPASLLRRVLAGCLGQPVDASDPWNPDRMVWTLLEVLPSLMAEPEFARVAAYLEEDKGSFEVASIGRRRFALARHIADLFDRYAIYRPWMVRAWSAGEAAGPELGSAIPPGFEWQPRLWKAIADRLAVSTLAERFESTHRALEGRSQPLAGLPERINFFGLSALPPSYLAVLQSLSCVHDVHMFLLCPSREYWGEIRTRSEILRQTEDPHEVDAELALEGNPILASFGRLARDFQLRLESHEGPDYVEEGEQPFDDPLEEGSTSMLGVLQSDILNLRTRGGTEAVRELPASADDRSIQIHSCHGVTRQVEVLREAILRLMEDPATDLQPRDVVVMTPDIEIYAPVISAVFSEGRATALEGSVAENERWGSVGAPQLPFAIADRSLRQTNPVAAALLHVLGMVHGRVEASTVLDLLRMEVVRARFDIDAEDIQRVEQWVRDSGIRWGIDRDHREKHAQPDDHENTWRFGLDRLLLGVAMADENERDFRGVVPFDDMEGGAVDLLGRFADFCDTLFTQLRHLDHPRSLEDWAEGLEVTVERLVRTRESNVWHLQQVREVLLELRERATDASGVVFAEPLELDAIRSLLSGSFQIGRGSVGHQTGAVTFCAMVPMRSIPHRVVCLLGMDDGAFPRGEHAPALDIISLRPRIGDRSPREEDRFLFLEAVLAARESLIVTYSGRDIRTNEPLPPAVPVGQLLDVLDGSFAPATGFNSVRDQITTEHPLQAFSPENFRARHPKSYDRSLLEGARRLSEARREVPRFITGPLDRSESEEAETAIVSIDDLIRFWQSPVAALVSRTLGIYLREDQTLTEDREPVELDHLQRWMVGAQLLTHRLRGRGGDWGASMMARGALPPGAPGECSLQDAERQVDRILEASSESRTQTPTEVPIDLQLADQRLIGTIKSVHGTQLLRLQFGTIRPKHRLAQWIKFLALNAQRPEVDWSAMIFGKDDKPRTLRVLPADGRGVEALRRLEWFAARYAEGQNSLLPFFDQTSYAYATRLSRGGSPRQAWGAAAAKWHAEWGPVPGEDANPYHAQAFGPDAPWAEVYSEAFAALALDVWRPILEAEGR